MTDFSDFGGLVSYGSSGSLDRFPFETHIFHFRFHDLENIQIEDEKQINLVFNCWDKDWFISDYNASLEHENEKNELDVTFKIHRKVVVIIMELIIPIFVLISIFIIILYHN
ncbi:MAG: hypothetical protein ACFE9L_12490 [Candidatus Hodarchaeota archaeon]